MMSTKIYSEFSTKSLDEIAHRIKAGQIIIYPTETVWAVGCISTNKNSVEKIYKIKKRPQNTPFINIIDTYININNYVNNFEILNLDILKNKKKSYTIIYPNCKIKYDYLSNEANEIAFRITPVKILKELIVKINAPLISTSANISGKPFAKTIDEISPSIFNSVDVILNFEILSTGKPSSIIKINNNQIEYLRR